jgi:hypothetical protein
VKVEIYGIKENPQQNIKIVVDTLSRGKSTIKTRTYRMVYEKDKLLKKEVLSTDSYLIGH